MLTINEDNCVDLLVSFPSNFYFELVVAVVFLIKSLFHDVLMHHFAVHHILIVLRDQRDDEVEKNDQENDLGHKPEQVD